MRTGNLLWSRFRAATIMMLCGGQAASHGGESTKSETSVLAYIGTYTGPKSKGIYMTRFDPATGSFTAAELAAEVVNPSFLAVHPNHLWLYAVNETETFGAKRAGAVSAFRIDRASGKLTLLNQQPAGGTGPCHVSVDKTGECVLAANYGSGSVATFKVGRDGSLSGPVTVIQHQGSSVNPQRQAGPHAHHIVPDPKNRFVLACDLGLDQVLVYKFDPAKALLTANAPATGTVAPGSGPRHLAFHPRQNIVYVLNELTSTLTSFGYNAESGALIDLSTASTLPEGFRGRNSGAEVQAHPSGKYVYTSNRGDDSIAIFAIDEATGIAAYTGREPTQGRTPRHIALDPTGRWLIAENQDSDNVVSFRINESTGALTASGHQLRVGTPVCVAFVPSL